MENQNKIGMLLKKFRVMTGFTQARLAEKLSEVSEKTVAPTAIAGYESGTRTPKVETRVQIANILGVDPVELSGIDLSETDEKRLLCKLIHKYGKKITADENGNVTVKFDDDLYGFYLTYSDVTEKMENLSGLDEENAFDFINRQQGYKDEMDFWLDTYPKFDPVYKIKSQNEECSVEKIKETDDELHPSFTLSFYDFYDYFLVPLRHKKSLKDMMGWD